MFLTIAVLAITILSSCAKTEKILVKKDGVWNMDKFTSTLEITGLPTTTDTESNYGTITFKDDGTGVFNFSLGFSQDFTWEVNDDIITITAGGDVTNYDILESEKDYQKWSNVTTETAGGVTSTYTYVIELSPVE